MVQQQTNELQLLIKAVGYLRTHWWLITIEIITIFASGVYIFRRTPQVFESHGALLVDSSRRQIYQQVLSPGSQNSAARRQNMANLFTSNEAFERTRAQLVEIYQRKGSGKELDFFFPGGNPLPAATLRGYTSFGWDRNSDIYNLSCTGPNPTAARDFCLAYINAVQAYYPEIGQRETMMKHDFIQKEIKSLTTQITDRETALAEFERKNSEFMTFTVMDSGEKGLLRLHDEENTAKEKMAINRAIRDLLVRSRASKVGVHNTLDTTVNALTLRLQDLQYQLQLTKESPNASRLQSVASLNTEIDRVSSEIAKLNEVEVEDSLRDPIPSAERRRRIADLELEFRTDGVKLQGIHQEIAFIQSQEKKFQVQRLEYNRYISDLENRKKLLSTLYEKAQETELDLSAGSAEIFRLEEPLINGARIQPNLTRILFASLSLSIFVTIATLILLIGLVPRLDSEAEVNRLNIPVLGKVPSMRSGPIFGDRDATFGYEYAKIMNYRILRETKDIKCPIVVITSANAREGKSTVAHLLCMASESRERKTLMVDGDLLTLSHNKPFKIHEDATPGIKSILDKGAGQLSALAVPTSYDGVSLIPRGARVETSILPNFLDPMRKALENARKEYDMIFIDTPPLFQSNLAHQWAGIADLVVLVARLYYTRPRDVIEAIQTVKIFSKVPVGTALNCVPMGGMHRRGSHYYYFTRKKPKAPNLAA